MPDTQLNRLRSWAAQAAQPIRRAFAPVAAVLEGAGGTHAYRGYLAHHARHHPEKPPLSQAEFFRESLEARWHGVKRCC